MMVEFCGLHMQVGLMETDNQFELVDLENGMLLSHFSAGIAAPEGCCYIDSSDLLVSKVVKIMLEEGAVEPIASEFSVYPLYRITAGFKNFL